MKAGIALISIPNSEFIQDMETIARKILHFFEKFTKRIKAVSNFSNQLQAGMENCGFTQTEVCEKLPDISQAALSRYMNGENRPPVEVLEKLASIFRKESQVALLTAYLADDVPASLKQLVAIEPRAGTRVHEEPTVYRSRMPRDLREAYEGIGAAALEKESVAKMLIAHWDVIKPRQ